MTRPLKVSIVGAGLGGLSAAIALRQRGCDVTVFEQSDVEHATAKLIGMFETEATKCAKAKAYYAACVMIGSASEARLLLKCLQEPTELAAAKAKIPATKGFHKGAGILEPQPADRNRETSRMGRQPAD